MSLLLKILHHLHHLKPVDVCFLGATCRELHEVCGSDAVWEPLYVPRLRLRQEPMENYKYLALEVLLIKFDIQYSLLRRSINLNAICDEEIARRRENMDKCGKQRSALRARLARMAASTS